MGAEAVVEDLVYAGRGRGRGARGAGGGFRSAGGGQQQQQQQRWARSRSRSRGPDQQQQQRARSRSRGRSLAAGGARGRSRSRGGGGLGSNRSRSRSRSLAAAVAAARSRSRSRGPRSQSRGRSRSRSRPPAAALQGRPRSRSRSAVRGARSLTPSARGRGQRAPPRLVLFRAAPGGGVAGAGAPWPQSHQRLVRSRVRRAARFLNQRGRQATALGVGRLTNDWKMAGTFRSDYIVRQRNYHPNNTADMTNDIFFGAGDSGGNQLLVNIQNEYAMHPAPGARRTWPRSRGLRRNQFLGISNRRPQVDLAAGGDATASAAESLNSVRQTVALHGSTRNTAHNGLPRKMTESPAQLVPTLVVEQNVVENMGQPSASTTRMTLSERFSKRHTTSDDSEALYAQGDN